MDWKPFPKQEIALKTKVFELLYGGARGPGKTDAGIVWMLKCVDNSRFRGLVIRLNATDLSDWLSRARVMYKKMGGLVVGNEIRFPSGAVIITGHLKDEAAYEKYQGHEYQRVLIEELTQIPSEERYLKLIASCRSTIEGIDPRVFATANPGGRGHSWVKKRFVDPATPGTKFKDSKSGRDRIFISATIKDNPILIEKDPDYVNFLKSLPDQLRDAWYYGKWDVFFGMYFDRFDRDTHVYDPKEIKIDKHWPRFVSIDWGYNDQMAIYWHAVGPDQHIYTYREYYERERMDEEAADDVVRLSKGENIRTFIGDPNSFSVRVSQKHKLGYSYIVQRKEVWAKRGVPITLGNNSRIPGWSRLRQYMRVREYMGKPSSWWHISKDCPNLIAEIQAAVYDSKNVEDIDDACKDHALDSCRYGFMSLPPLFKDPMQGKPKTEVEAAFMFAENEKDDW